MKLVFIILSLFIAVFYASTLTEVFSETIAELEAANVNFAPPNGAALETTAALNVRDAACTSGKVIRTLAQGTRVKFEGQSKSGCGYTWWYISGGFGKGWAASNWLRIVGTTRKTNQRGVDLIKSFEGKRNCKYKDPVGIWTICYGHVIKPGENFNCLTDAQCEALLKSDLATFESCVSKNVKRSINDNQFSALVSFSFNVGCGALQSSTLLKYVNEGRNADAVCGEFRKWVKAGGKTLPGLVRRREAECQLYRS